MAHRLAALLMYPEQCNLHDKLQCQNCREGALRVLALGWSSCLNSEQPSMLCTQASLKMLRRSFKAGSHAKWSLAGLQLALAAA
jgi:hypothetical protein